MARKRASSLQQAVQYAQHPPLDHHLNPENTLKSDAVSPSAKSNVFPQHTDAGLWNDMRSFQWMLNPASSFKMIAFVLSAWMGWSILLPDRPNPLDPFVKISYPLPRTLTESNTRYGKGALDLCFLSFYVIVFSFTRQASFEYLIKPLARYHNLRSETKMLRFQEQAYTCLYMGFFATVGLWVMSDLPTWWYKTEQFWIGYPHWRMTAAVKLFYLLEFSYWLQQMLVMALKLEKPRSDYKELIAHHFVTLWLVGWSYSINLTMIGVSIFVTMDVSDTFLALSKCINYIKYQRTSEATFAFFLCVWTYFRHYLNLKILWSVWTEWDALIPAETRHFRPSEGIWMVWWMKWQIFAPIFLLQLINLFWYYLMWRIVFRMLSGKDATDVREEGEDSDEDAPADKKAQ